MLSTIWMRQWFAFTVPKTLPLPYAANLEKLLCTRSHDIVSGAKDSLLPLKPVRLATGFHE